MLIKFAVTNFRGFRERLELDLTKHRDYEFNDFAIKDGTVKNGIVYGPNGCGKSNFGLAIFDIVTHLTDKVSDHRAFSTYYLYANGVVKPSAFFEYTFKLGNQLLEYSYSKDINRSLVEESLSVDKNEIFSRKQGKLQIAKEFKVSEDQKQNLVSNANNVSIIRFLLGTLPLQKDHYLIKLQNFVNSMLFFRSLRANEFVGLENKAELLEEYVIKHNLLDDFSNFLKETSGQNYKFTTVPVAGLNNIVCCKIDDKLPPMVFNGIYSTGTEALLLLYFWYKHLENASFVYIDEFDAFYHFDLAYRICKRLFTFDCQLFLSSHNTYLMKNELLRPDCNFILNNNKIKALCDCTEKDLRQGHNVEKLYRSGDVFNI